MRLYSIFLGAIALSNLVRASPIPSNDYHSLRERAGASTDEQESPVLVCNSAVKLWNQVPTRYDMARSLRKDDVFKELAGVADAIINVKPDWIPGTIFQASTAYYRNGTAAESNAYEPFVLAERDNLDQVHVPVLRLFGNKNPIYLMDYTFKLLRDGSTIAWYHALQQAFHVPIVQERLASLNPNYANAATLNDNVYHVMAMMEMLTGETPQQLGSNEFPWRSDGEELDVVPGFDPLSYSPTVIYTEDTKLRPITRSEGDRYLLLDCRVFGPGEWGTPEDKYDGSLELRELQMNWGVRLDFQTPVNNDYVPLLSVVPPSVNTDAYLSHSPSIYY